MIGDRLGEAILSSMSESSCMSVPETDILMATRGQIQSILVLTGSSTEAVSLHISRCLICLKLLVCYRICASGHRMISQHIC